MLAPTVSATMQPVVVLPNAAPSVSGIIEVLHPELPQVRTSDDMTQHATRRVELQGRYEVTPVRQGKAPHPVFIVLDDGERVVRSYGPVEDELRFDGQRVVVIGHVFPQGTAVPGHTQQMGAHHVVVESLSLHPMVSPFSNRSEIRTPPDVVSRDDLRRLQNHWVQLLVRVMALQPQGEVVDAEVMVADGTPLRVRTIDEKAWQALVGAEVTIIGRLSAEAEPRTLLGVRAICAGRVQRCGMD